jgi:hypothetical protein
MMRRLVPVAILVAVLLAGASPSDAKPPSGRSYSSGSRSSSSSGRSFSSGRSSSPAPSRSVPSGRGYSSGRSSAPAPSRPSAPAPSRPAPSGGGYSSGRSSSPAPSRPPSSGGGIPWVRPSPTPAPRNPSGKSYTSPSFDKAAADAQRKAESRRAYTQGKEPKPEYRAPTGQTKPINPQSPSVDELRRKTDSERWAEREIRQRRTYGPYIGMPPVIYHDPFGSLFWWWLLAQNLDTRAHWAYHHRHEMDEARYRELLRKDAQLEEKIRELEQKGVPRDPKYTPPNIDPDQMYTDEYVDAALNPQPRQPHTPTYPHAQPGSSLRDGLRFLARAFVVLAIFAFLIWFVFFKRWGTAAPPPERNRA